MHECNVFHTQIEVDSVREFTHWLSSGGMNDLRELSTIAETARRFRSASIIALAGIAVASVVAALVAGLKAMWQRG